LLEAEAADANSSKSPRQVAIWWREPSGWASRTGLGLYLFDLELRRLANTLPLVYPELRSERAELSVPGVEKSSGDTDLDVGLRERAVSRPRPLPSASARLEVTDAASGSVELLLGPVGALVDLLNSHPVLAVATAVTLAQAARPGVRIAIRVVRVSLDISRRLTLQALHAALQALVEEPRGRYVAVIRIQQDGSVTLVLMER
jgi:hypothetical protein